MPALFLYEPRMLLRSAVTSFLEEENLSIQSHQMIPPLIESISGTVSDNKILLIGVAGAGNAFFEVLRLVRRMKSLKIKTLVWLPGEYPWMVRLLNAIYATQVISEDDLESTLLPVLRETIAARPIPARQNNPGQRARSITLTELDILLQFASGLSSREMAEQRDCSYKTIFSWKHNLCEALHLESHAHWLEMLTELSQLSSLYRAG